MINLVPIAGQMMFRPGTVQATRTLPMKHQKLKTTGAIDSSESIDTMSVPNSSQNESYPIINLQNTVMTETEMQNMRP